MSRHSALPEAPYYCLELSGSRLYLQACGARELTDDEVVIHALLVLGPPEGIAALRQRLTGPERHHRFPLHVPGGKSLEGQWGHHLILHPHIIARRIAPGATSALAVPRCSLLPYLRQCNQGSRLVAGRTREELLHNAFLRLMVLSSIPMHPSWEGPVMEHLEREGLDGGLEVLAGPPALRFAIIYPVPAYRTVERLWKAGKLPDPAPTSAGR